MKKDQDKPAKVEKVEIDPLSDDDLDSASGGANADIAGATDGCPSDGCPSDSCPSDGCPSDGCVDVISA